MNPPTPPLINHGIDELCELKELKPHLKHKLPTVPNAATPGNTQAPLDAKLLYDDSLAAFAPSAKPGPKKPFDLLETACIEAPLSNLRARAAVRGEYSALKERHRRRKKISMNIVSDVVEVESEDDDEVVEVWQGGLD